jgi:2-dehydro-3-deoxyphosphogluconate aldolase/(4S)-4-hydroxy-2-oxoglutarate aldolase
LPFLRIVPTSGVDAGNAREFLEAGAFAVGFVAPLFDPGELAEERFDLVEDRARRILSAIRGG